MKKLNLLLLFVALLGTTVFGQKEAKPWSEWSKDDVTKMLDKSPWGHVITNTDASNLMVTMGVAQTDQGPTNQAISWNYRVRFFSAKPIRQAFARKLLLDNPNLKPQQLENFVNGDYSESIVIAVAFDSVDRRYLAEREKAFNHSTTEQLAKNVYLELKGGQRIPLEEYSPPTKDGTGAKFVFPRNLNGKPYITDEKELIRFVANMGETGIGFEYRFKVSEMMFEGKLEY
jgi:hypothetical protein